MTRDDQDRLAAEYVLGLLEGEEAALAARMADEDEDFARLAESWRMRFLELDETAERQSPGDDLWSRISGSVAAVVPESALESAPSHAPIVPPVLFPERPQADAPRPGWLTRLWEDLGFWRTAGLAGATAALLLAVGLGFAMREAVRKPVLVAVLLTDANQPAGIVNAFADGRAELLPLQSIDVPPGRVLEIWTLWDRARGPVSLGTLQSARSVPLRLDHLPKTSPDQLFEITLEPEGGSKTGRPTGPILMKGTTSLPL